MNSLSELVDALSWHRAPPPKTVEIVSNEDGTVSVIRDGKLWSVMDRATYKRLRAQAVQWSKIGDPERIEP